MNRFQKFAAILALTLICTASSRGQNLKLLVSVQQSTISASDAVRATLHFHNSGRQTLWLYRPVLGGPPDRISSIPAIPGENGPVQHHSGATLAVHLNALGNSEKGKAAGSGFAIAPDALPFPRLERLASGGDYTERVNIHIEPTQTAAGDNKQAVWGRYSFSVRYSANYSNAAALARDVGATLWQGQVSSNSITLDLHPSTGQSSIEGTVLGSIGRPYGGALVTLSDDNESALDQLYSNQEGQFSFTHLPAGRYWITVRQPGSDHDTSVFRHIDLNQPGARATPEIMMIAVRAYKADRVLHKPVLFHIVDSKGHPLAKVRLGILYSSENVIQNLKTQTGDDGSTAISLIPGSNFVTMKSHGCRKEERRADIAPGPGVDGFKFVYECTKK